MPVKCPFCEMCLVSEDHLVAHMRMHTEGYRRPFHCPECSFSASRKDVVTTHMKTHREGILYYCLHCPFIASNMTAFTRHKKVHNSERMSLQMSDVEAEDSVGGLNQSNFGASLEHLPQMGEHSSRSYPRQYGPRQEDRFEDDKMENLLHPEVNIQVKQEQELLYACPVCNFNTTSNSEMEDHLDESEEDQLYTCDECDLTFCSFQSAANHREIHLLEEGNAGENMDENILLPDNPTENRSQILNNPYEPVPNRPFDLAQVEPMVNNGTMTMYLEPSTLGENLNFSPADYDSEEDFSEDEEYRDPDWKPNAKARSRLQRKRANVANPHPDPLRKLSTKLENPCSSSTVAGPSPSLNGNNVQVKSEAAKIVGAPKKSPKKGSKKAPPRRPVCVFCNKIFSCPSSLNLHIRIHTGEKPFKCHKCSFSSSQKGNLRTHLSTHTGILVKCQFCNYTGTNTATVNAHIRNGHPGVQLLQLGGEAIPGVKSETIKAESPVVPVAAPFNNYEQIKTNNKKRIQKYRSRSLAWAVKSQRAIAVKQEPGISKEEEEVKPRILNETVPIPNNGFHCPVCKITCKSVDTFRRHDCSQKRFGCSHCSYTCRTLYHLKRHWKTHKTGILESCPDCSFQTSSSRGLTRHFREVHQGRKYGPKAGSPQI